MVTLTYGRDKHGNEDHFRAAWLTYSDVQKYFKLLRRDGYKFRYLICGEYGSVKGRAHWHALMFWENRVPPHELSTMGSEKRFENKYWPHGFQHWEKPNVTSIRYVCKYIQKDIGKEERQGHLSMSKKPPLGNAYFRWLAEEYVRHGLAPQHLKYTFPDVRGKDGKPVEYYMGGTTAHNFIEHYKAAWQRHSGGHHPNSALIEEHDDRLARDSWLTMSDRWGKHVDPPYGGNGPYLGPCPDDDGRQRMYSDDERGRLWYRPNEEGEYGWLREVKITMGLVPSGTTENRYGKAKRGPDDFREKRRRR